MDYTHFNNNPLGKREKDCVTRAISLACKLDYFTVAEKLILVAKLLECEKLCVCCYEFLLDDVFKLKRVNGYRGCKIKDLDIDGRFLIRVEGHLTCVIDQTIYDIWDCSNEIIDIVWEIT